MKKFIVLLLLVIAAAPASAGVAGRCRRLCRPEIVRCWRAGYTRVSCRRALRAACVQIGGAVCQFVPPTTTTVPPLSPTTTTTTLPPPTTTTTLPPSTTTTTLPPQAVLDVSGVWNVTAVLSSNPCLLPAPAILTPTLDLVQAGSSLTGSWGAFYASGYVAGDSFVVSTPVYCFGSCCAVFALNMSGIVATPSGLAGSACVGWDGVCTDGTMCPVLWCG